MIIENIKPFEGEHCETTATGTLLRQLNIELSEPMLFGLGEGLGFIFWKMKSMSFPFIGGRGIIGYAIAEPSLVSFNKAKTWYIMPAEQCYY